MECLNVTPELNARGYLSRVDYECKWMNKRMKVEKGLAIWKGLKSRAKPSHLH